MAFFSTHSAEKLFTVDIIGVPAIGADPKSTWAQSKPGGNYSWLNDTLREKIPSARILLYDHLNEEERRLEIKVGYKEDREQHLSASKMFRSTEAAHAKFSVEDWAHRFSEALKEIRSAHEDHPMLFICHSTGGIVVKQALVDDEKMKLVTYCIGVAFFATPHHGSMVLSASEYAHAIQKCLGLKWKMSERLRQDLSLKNPFLEKLNSLFINAADGVKFHSYYETDETELEVLLSSDTKVDTLTPARSDPVRWCVVNDRSARLSAKDSLIENESVFELNTTHAGTPNLIGQNEIHRFIDTVDTLVKNFSLSQRRSHLQLNLEIMENVIVNIHQLYQGREPALNKVLSARPSLKHFLCNGPTKCLDEEITKSKSNNKASTKSTVQPTRGIVPRIEISLADSFDDMAPPIQKPIPTLVIPESETSNDKRTPHPLKNGNFPDIKRPGYSGPAKAMANLVNLPASDETQEGAPQHPPTYQVSTSPSEPFRWIHIPFTHSGWVPRVLTAVSVEKDDVDLHAKLMMNQIWKSQHNQSRHASPHAQFVRPAVRFLPRKENLDDHFDRHWTPSSAIDEAQFVLYLPYLHWDTFKNMKIRNKIIENRRKQAYSYPVNPEISIDKSIERMLMWHYLQSERPAHCRRTLDQYGYPSLNNTAMRDLDQVLYKRTKKNPIQPKKFMRWSERHSSRLVDCEDPLSPSDDLIAKVLMVDQLWLWILNNETVITFAAPKEKEDGDDEVWKQGDLHDNIHNDISGDYAKQCHDPFDFAALAVLHAIKTLLENTTDPNLQVFRIFEEYISVLTESQNHSFKSFHYFQKPESSKNVNDHLLRRYNDNQEDLDNLLELRDIQDELKTMEKLFEEQRISVDEMITKYQRLNEHQRKGKNGVKYLQEAERTLRNYKGQVGNMLSSAVAAEEAFKYLLDMKQKQANIEEAHLAREHAATAEDQSRSVMIFTIFTIIFLPLSFFASVFSINAREWTGTSSDPKLHNILVYMISISVAVIIVALLLAFNRPTRKAAQVFWKWLGGRVLQARGTGNDSDRENKTV